jgi:ribokinase
MRILVVGSLNVDLVVRVPELPRPGETVLALGAERLPGGKGGNQAVAARRLGAEVAFVGAVGDDPDGADLLRWLAAEGVDTAGVATVPGALSGRALIDVRPDGENMITVLPGANHDVDPGRAGAPTQADALLLQLELRPEVSAAAARAATGEVVLNAAPLPTPVSAEVLALIAAATVLVVNETEAAALPRGLLALGPRLAVVTRGAAGASWAHRDGSHGEQPGFAVRAVDAVGAGDTFAAALALATCAGLPPAEALRRACAAAALATTRPGAQAAMPTAAEVAALLA